MKLIDLIFLVFSQARCKNVECFFIQKKDHVKHLKNESNKCFLKRQHAEYLLFRDALAIPNAISSQTKDRDVVLKTSKQETTKKSLTSNQLKQLFDHEIIVNSNQHDSSKSLIYYGQLAEFYSALEKYMLSILAMSGQLEYVSSKEPGPFVKEAFCGTKMSDKKNEALEESIYHLHAAVVSRKFEYFERKQTHHVFTDYKRGDQKSTEFPFFSVSRQSEKAFFANLSAIESILSSFQIEYRLVESGITNLQFSSMRSIKVEARSPSTGLWHTFGQVNLRDDFIASRLGIFYEDDRKDELRYCYTCDGNFASTGVLMNVLLEKQQKVA